MPPDELAAKRWLRELFRKLGEQCPGLKDTAKREKLTAELERQNKEESSSGEKR